ncbi:MAG: hypothetical protein IKO75_01390 [Bacteroidales bacterium]|nr:hypothetical protein [Bacteroidales bacterium]
MKPSISCMVMLAVVGITACKSGDNTAQSPQEEGHRDTWEFYLEETR